MTIQPANEERFSVATRSLPPANRPESLKEPTPLFLCGSLMDPEVLAAIARLPGVPPLQDALVTGFRSKLFGSFPALVPDARASSPVRGKLWVVDNTQQLQRLRAYMSSSYQTCACEIYTKGGPEGSKGEDTVKGLAFVWNGNPESGMLADGEFDVDEYERTIKPAVLTSSKPQSKGFTFNVAG